MISDTELIEKYGRLCGHIAWCFVRQSWKDKPTRPLWTEDAEDLASVAMIALLKCPQEHRHEPPYVKRIIVSKIINAWHKRVKTLKAEHGPEILPAQLNVNRLGRNGDTETWNDDPFDMLPGRDGLAGHTQVKFDSARMLSYLPQLPESERIVIELSFGLNGCQPTGLDRIGKKLGHSKDWADSRLKRGLDRLREISGVKGPWVGKSLQRRRSMNCLPASASM